MTTYYYAKGGTVVMGIATTGIIDAQIADPIISYGTGTYVIVDTVNPPPVYDDALPGYDYPTVTSQMQADSAKWDCQYRIFQKVSDNAQKNINAYVADLSAAAANGTAMSSGQRTDCTTAAAIHAWIGRPSGMLAACDTLISTSDIQWYLDVKWPAWNSSWDAFVARF